MPMPELYVQSLTKSVKQDSFLVIYVDHLINADLKISLYIQIHIKIIPWKFRILNRKNSRVIHP